MGKYFTRIVILLSLVSLFTDISSELLYPVLPFYLQRVGFSVIAIGLLEGVANVLRNVSGKMRCVTKWGEDLRRPK